MPRSECSGTPLKDVLAYLSDQYRIPIQIDSVTLREAACDESALITCKLSGIPLRSALEIILDGQQLKWTIHHDVLMITTPTKAESDEFMDTKCYDVTDLLVAPNEFGLANPISRLPEDCRESAPWESSGICYSTIPVVGMSNGVGAQSGSAQVATDTPPEILARVRAGRAGAATYGGAIAFHPANFDVLENLITTTIATKTWQENGGTGTISHHSDGVLVISQTRAVHTQIEQLLDELRQRRQAKPAFSVELHWLWLDAKHRGHLLAGRAKASDGQVSLTIDRQRLRQIARDVPGFHAQVASMNGLGTGMEAGDRRSIIMSATPVAYGVGFQPVVSVPNVGVTAQVRATMVPGTKTAMLDVASIITRWGPERKPAIVSAAWPAGKKVIATDSVPGSAGMGGMGGGMGGMGGGIFAIEPEHIGGNAPVPAAPPAQNPTKPAPATTPPFCRKIGATAQNACGLGFLPHRSPGDADAADRRHAPRSAGQAGNRGLDHLRSRRRRRPGAAKENPVEVYLVATTSIVREAGK